MNRNLTVDKILDAFARDLAHIAIPNANRDYPIIKKRYEKVLIVKSNAKIDDVLPPILSTEASIEFLKMGNNK